VARRALRSNPDGELGEFLGRLVRELEEDEASLEQVMRALGLRRNPLKKGTVLILERVGRLKLNGQIRGYSDLSRVLELEGLLLMVEMKRALWRSLQESGRSVPVDLAQLIERAERQRGKLEPHRAAAARRAFRDGGHDSSSSSGSLPAGST
jgi:hypothetical protein